MKRHYSEYAQHSLRYYFTMQDEPTVNVRRSASETENFIAAQKAVSDLDERRLNMLKAIITAEDPLPVAVHNIAAEYGETDIKVWGFLAYTEKRFAQFRGLL